MTEASTTRTCEPPRCPLCGANLFRVVETTQVIYEFNTEKGVYEEFDAEAKTVCLECDTDVYDLFPEGVCNFESERGCGKRRPIE